MESYQFPSAYTIISGLLDDVDNSKRQNFELRQCWNKQAIFEVPLANMLYKSLYYPLLWRQKKQFYIHEIWRQNNSSHNIYKFIFVLLCVFLNTYF